MTDERADDIAEMYANLLSEKMEKDRSMGRYAGHAYYLRDAIRRALAQAASDAVSEDSQKGKE